MNSKADIVIVGGGPVGCWTALQVKKRNPALNVVIYERYEEYQRDHMMTILAISFNRYSKRTGDENEKRMFEQIASANHDTRGQEMEALLEQARKQRESDDRVIADISAKMNEAGLKKLPNESRGEWRSRRNEFLDAHNIRHLYEGACGSSAEATRTIVDLEKKIDDLEKSCPQSLQKKTLIRTLDLERILKLHCRKLGVNFVYRKIESPQDVMSLHPECRTFIAADGARSAMRSALLGDTGVVSKDLLHSIDVKYEVNGRARYMMEPTFDKMDAIVVETVGKAENGRSSVALRFIVDEETYKAVPQATFRDPFHVDASKQDGRYVGDFAHTIRRFQGLRERYAGEDRIEGTERITKIMLSQYASKKFALRSKHADSSRRAGWFFVGDAAMGMPFYRSINSGFLLGSQLAAIVANDKWPTTVKTGLYSGIRPLKVAREFGAVSAKLSGIRLYKNIGRPALRGVGEVMRYAIGVPIVVAAIPVVWTLDKLGVKVRLM